MQEYPTHLLPRSEYRIIEQDNLHSHPDMFLIRHIESDKINYIDGTNTLNPDCITIQSNHLHDLSCNLLGIFKEKDVCYVINKDIENPLWFEGTVDAPSQEEFTIDEKRGHYFVNIDLLLKTTFPTNQGGTCSFVIIHTPVKYNFWHVSIRVLDSDGIEVNNSEKSNSQKRKIWTIARDFLLTDEIISQSVSSHTIIPEKSYINPI